MDTDSLYLPPVEKEPEDLIWHEMKRKWEKLQSKEGNYSFTVDPVGNFVPRKFCKKLNQRDKREPGLITEKFTCTELLCLLSKTYCCYDVNSNKPKLSSKGLNKLVVEQSEVGPLEKHRRALDEKINITSISRSFLPNNQAVATYQQIRNFSSVLSKYKCGEWWKTHLTSHFANLWTAQSTFVCFTTPNYICLNTLPKIP